MDHPHPPSAGKDLTGGPGPWAQKPGFLCSQQRPQNRPAHARTSVLSALSLCEEPLRGLTRRCPKPVAGEGAVALGRAPNFPSTPRGLGDPRAQHPLASCSSFPSPSVRRLALLATPLSPKRLSPSPVPETITLWLPSTQITPNSALPRCTPLLRSLPCPRAPSRCPPSERPCPWLTRRGAELRLPGFLEWGVVGGRCSAPLSETQGSGVLGGGSVSIWQETGLGS